MKKKFMAMASSILAILALSACAKNGGDLGANPLGSSAQKETGVNFFKIVGEITGKEVSIGNVPYYFTIGNDGSYCTIDTNPLDLDDYSSSTALDYIKQMNENLELPDYVYQEMITTSYSQGKQTESYGNISVTWYYHPDKGLNATYKKTIAQ